MTLAGIRGLLIDIDGVLAVSWRAIEGAPQALSALRSGGVPFRLLTNTTELTRRELVALLRGAGFEVRDEEVITAALMTAEYLRTHHAGARCFLVGGAESPEDLEGIELVTDRPDVVVIGGTSKALTWEETNQALRFVLGGAELVGMHATISWMTEEGIVLDPGVMLLRALEAASGQTAVVCGKPSPEAFGAALGLLGLAAGEAAMIGDDLETDVLAAQAVGMIGVLVQTGKFRREALERSDGQPDLVLESIREVPALLLA